MGTVPKEIKSILIIDDDIEDYELVSEILQDINPEILVSYIGTCDDIKKYHRQHFDLVLLDLNMPHYDGFFWLKAIRDRGYSDLPIIVYTNSLSPIHIERAYNEGANLYFSKPVSYNGMVRGLSKLIQLNWNDPGSITTQYARKGEYGTFKYA